MFTGIVEELGHIESFEGGVLRLRATRVLDGVAIGDSIAVDGCCLTVVDAGEGWWQADVSDETRSRTTLSALRPGARVNLERAVRLADRLGGHLVQGHVDAVGEVLAACPDLRIRVPRHLHRYLVEKGSVAVDGVSLTVVEPREDGFTVAVIPHTAAVTTLGTKQPGDQVNLEVDVMAKYAERLLAAHLPTITSSATTGDPE